MVVVFALKVAIRFGLFLDLLDERDFDETLQDVERRLEGKFQQKREPGSPEEL